MEDQRLGSLLRAVRHQRGWRQADLGQAAGVSGSLVSLIERGHLDRLALRTLREVAAALDIRLDVLGRWRGGDADRLLNAPTRRCMSRWLASSLRFDHEQQPAGREPGQDVDRAALAVDGKGDLGHGHPAGKLKTELVDVQALIGTVDRYRRLAPRIARERGWDPRSVSVWVVLAERSSNRRGVAAHATVLRSVFPRRRTGDARLAARPSGSGRRPLVLVGFERRWR